MENHINLLFSPRLTNSRQSPVAIEFRNKGETDSPRYGTFGLIKDDRDKLYGVTGAHILPGFNGESVEQQPADVYQVSNEYVGDLGEKVLAEFDDKQEIDIAVFEITKQFKQSIRPDGLAEKETIPVYTGELGDLMGADVSKLGATTGYTEGKVVDIQGDQIFIISDQNKQFADVGDSGALVTADVKGTKFCIGLVQMFHHVYQRKSFLIYNVVSCVSLSKSLQAISTKYGESVLHPAGIKAYQFIGDGKILGSLTPSGSSLSSLDDLYSSSDEVNTDSDGVL